MELNSVLYCTKEVKTTITHAYCLKCNSGEMISTERQGYVVVAPLTTGQANGVHHTCNNAACGHTDILPNRYPLLSYTEV